MEENANIEVNTELEEIKREGEKQPEEAKEYILQEGQYTAKEYMKADTTRHKEKSETEKALEIILGVEEKATRSAMVKENQEESEMIRKAREFRSVFELMEKGGTT